MKNYMIEQKSWYNKYLQSYQTILIINDVPQDLTKFVKREVNVKISDFSVNHNLCNNCFYYFIKQECGNCFTPMDICDISILLNLLLENGYEILYKETKLIKEFNKNLIFVIRKLIQ